MPRTNESGIAWIQPKITGIGHGEVFVPCQVISAGDEDQFVSNELVGKFIVYGVNMNSMTIFDSPYGNVEIEWEDAHGGVETATLQSRAMSAIRAARSSSRLAGEERAPATMREPASSCACLCQMSLTLSHR